MRTVIQGLVLVAAVVITLFALIEGEPPVQAQPKDFGKVKVTSQALAKGIYMLEGSGGNIGVSVGADGTMMIDDQFAELTPKLLAAMKKLGGKSVRFVVNTHWHFDHTGSNEKLAKAGAVIVAQDNVRARLSTDQTIALMGTTIKASPAKALPLITYADRVTFHINGDDVEVIHVAPAHTDGDSIVHFVKANVIHMGDTFVTSGFPFVDVSSGGTFAGFIAAADQALAIADDQTKIIPGHGTLSDKAGLATWRAMLVAIRDKVAAGVKAGKSLADVQASKPTAEFDAAKGGGFIKAEQLVEWIYTELQAQAKPNKPRKP